MPKIRFISSRLARVSTILFLLVTGFAASAALASTIHGTAKNNVIHGTAGSDTIYGLAGNDAIYGLGGNDKLYGGAGNDKLYGGTGKNVLDCGPGKDIAYTGPSDTVRNCETVHRTAVAPSPSPPPPPPPTTTTTPTPTTTTAAPPESGTYCGFLSQGGGICFDLTGSPLVFTNAKWTVTFDNSDCSPASSGAYDYEWDFTTTGSAPVSSTGAFDFNITQGDGAGTDLTGTANTTGGAAGKLVLQSVLTNEGTTYNCTLNLTWTANRQ